MEYNSLRLACSRLACSKCSKEFTSKSGLSRHMQLHIGQFRFFCDACRKGYNNNTAYKSHMAKHEGVKYKCDVCTKSFGRKELLRDHKSVHTGMFRFQCNLWLRDHKSVHTGMFRFQCNLCGKGFNTRARVKQAHCISLNIEIMKNGMNQSSSYTTGKQFLHNIDVSRITRNIRFQFCMTNLFTASCF